MTKRSANFAVVRRTSLARRSFVLPEPWYFAANEPRPMTIVEILFLFLSAGNPRRPEESRESEAGDGVQRSTFACSVEACLKRMALSARGVQHLLKLPFRDKRECAHRRPPSSFVG